MYTASSRICAFSLSLCAILAACDRSDQLVEAERAGSAAAGHLVGGQSSPRRIIDESIAAYQRLSSYEDNAYVSLRYRLEGEPAEDRAPMSVAWEQSSGLGLKVYSLVAGPSDNRWRLRLDRDDLVADHQVLSRAVPKDLNFEWLLADPTVAQGLAAGLAGFPPQLDLLLGEEPLQGLIDQATMLSFDENAVIDERACYVIQVARAGRTYRLFIDQASMLLRRLELPAENLPPAMLADGTVTDASLSIEFEQIKVDQDVAWDRFEVEVGSGDVLVNHFLPPIYPPELKDLGIRVPAFSLRSPTGEVIFDCVRPDNATKAVVMMWLADHPSCRLAAEQLAAVAKVIQQDPDLAKQVRLLPIWAEPEPPAGYTFDALSEAWQLPADLALDSEALGRDLFRIEQAPSLVVLDANRRIQIRETQANPMLGQLLPSLLKQLCAGRDLIAIRKREAEYMKRRMQADLRAAVAVDGIDVARRQDALATPGSSLNAEFMQLNHYPPAIVELVDQDTVPHSPPVTSCAIDEDYLFWTLHRDGQLVCRRNLTKGRDDGTSYQTGWSGLDHERLLIAPGGRFVARLRPNSASVDLFDVELEQSWSIDLLDVSQLADVAWLKLSENERPRLAAITNRREVLLLDPQDREQLSGMSDSRPLAILTNPASETGLGDGYVVLANRSVEPLQLSGDSILRAPSQPADLIAYSESSSMALSEDLKPLIFQPAAGPWDVCHDGQENWVLARGWLAKDEPGVFLLDEQLQPRWHRRMPIHSEVDVPQLMTSARDPKTGLATWFLSGADGTIYILRADGVTDHFRPNRPFLGLAAMAHAQDLLLAMTRADETQVVSILWK